MRRFFVVSSALLYTFAVMLGGHGVAALQEVGVLRATHVPFVRIEVLGIYPTAEGLGLQGLLVLAALFAALRAFTAARAAEAPAGAGEVAGSGMNE
jgi:high-affinity iron transporter